MKIKVKTMEWQHFGDIFGDIHYYSRQYFIGYFRIVDKIDVSLIFLYRGEEVEKIIATFINKSDSYENIHIVRNVEQAKSVCEGYILKIVNDLVEVEE